MKKVIKMVSVVSTVLLVLVVYLRQIPELNTQYTKDFSYQKFSKIERGMTKNQVDQILGKPFVVWNPGHECWSYSQDTGKFDLLIFEGFVSYQVCFQEGGVIDTPKTVF